MFSMYCDGSSLGNDIYHFYRPMESTSNRVPERRDVRAMLAVTDTACVVSELEHETRPQSCVMSQREQLMVRVKNGVCRCTKSVHLQHLPKVCVMADMSPEVL
jgi:hypothetical protein